MNIHILTGYDRFFGQTRKPWISMNVDLLTKHLNNAGVHTSVYEFSDIVNGSVRLTDTQVFYTFSQRENLRRYIIDAMADLQERGNRIIPSYDLLRCHENKGYQLLFAERHGIKDLWEIYCSSSREVRKYDIKYPVVLKTIDGSNGKGVFLARSHAELMLMIHKLEKPLGIATRIDLLRRKLFRQNERFAGYPDLDGSQNYRAYADYIKPEIPFVLQEFVPNLTCDYRVLILGDRFYPIRRMNREGDFRASGSKRFVYDTLIPEGMLDFAMNIHHTLQNPTLALDIGVSDKGFHLFEFQAQHTGISALINSAGYYQYSNKGWQYFQEKFSYEQCVADAITKYLMLTK